MSKQVNKIEKQLQDLKNKPVSEDVKKSINEKLKYINKPINKTQ